MVTFQEVAESCDNPLEFMEDSRAAFVKVTSYGRLEGWNLEALKEWKEDADKVLETFAQEPDDWDSEKCWPDHWDEDEGLKAWVENYWPGRWKEISEFASTYMESGWNEIPCTLAAWKTAETGHKWAVWECVGYAQSDWGSVIYDADALSDKDARRIGDYTLGCYTEYALKEDEENYVYGYFVADTDGNLSDADTKAYLAECEGVNPEDVRLLKIDGYHKVYDYREV